MRTIRKMIQQEPALVVTVALAVINAIANLSSGQEQAVRTIIESVLVLIGGGVVRSVVTPTAKLREGPSHG